MPLRSVMSLTFFVALLPLLLLPSSSFSPTPTAFTRRLSRAGVSDRRLLTSISSLPTAETFSLEKFLLESKVTVEEALQRSLPPPIPPFNSKITESMYYSLLAGGKRIRPILALATYDMITKNGGDLSSIMPTACALEMIHTMSLIHDDLPSMDDDSLRRGKPTNHVLYGEDVAILAGDALLSYAFEHVAKETKGVEPEKVLKVVGVLGEAVGPRGLAGGQVLDLDCEKKTDVTLKELQWIHTHKTATLLEVSCSCGGILGGASEREVAALTKFARGVGLAFQVADDILDCTASSEELGKTAGKDQEVDKTTYVKLLGLEGARKEATRLADEAKGALIEEFGEERSKVLLAIADFVVVRKN